MAMMVRHVLFILLQISFRNMPRIRSFSAEVMPSIVGPISLRLTTFGAICAGAALLGGASEAVSA